MLDDPFPLPPEDQRIDMDAMHDQNDHDPDYTYEEYDAEVSEGE